MIKLYHNTTIDALNEILYSGILDCHQHHHEGHGDMLWFTIDRDAWGNQVKISIQIDERVLEKNDINDFHEISARKPTNL